LEHQAELAIKQLGNALAKMASPESHATALFLKEMSLVY
jgi:hypothetical protein